MEFLVGVGLVVILGLGFYAGKLLFQLKSQNQRQDKARQVRIDNITESVRTISLAMEQQQCNLSEGAIRICNLLDAMPLTPQPDYVNEYPALYELYEKVQRFDTLEARNALSKAERRKQDKEREELESHYEMSVLKEVHGLKDMSVEL